MIIDRTPDDERRAAMAAYRRERRALGLDAMNHPGYVPIEQTRMVLTEWTTDEHGNAARQLRGM